MEIYKQAGQQSIERLSDNAFIPFDPANTDYQTFKAQINADEAQLEDADGNLMTAFAVVGLLFILLTLLLVPLVGIRGAAIALVALAWRSRTRDRGWRRGRRPASRFASAQGPCA